MRLVRQTTSLIRDVNKGIQVDIRKTSILTSLVSICYASKFLSLGYASVSPFGRLGRCGAYENRTRTPRQTVQYPNHQTNAPLKRTFIHIRIVHAQYTTILLFTYFQALLPFSVKKIVTNPLDFNPHQYQYTISCVSRLLTTPQQIEGTRADNENRTHILGLASRCTNRCAISAQFEQVKGIEPSSEDWKSPTLNHCATPAR